MWLGEAGKEERATLRKGLLDLSTSEWEMRIYKDRRGKQYSRAVLSKEYVILSCLVKIDNINFDNIIYPVYFKKSTGNQNKN